MMTISVFIFCELLFFFYVCHFDVYIVMINNSEEICPFFKKRGSPDFFVNLAQHCAQQINRQSALQPSQKGKNERIPFTLVYHAYNLGAKNIILKNFKLPQNDYETEVSIIVERLDWLTD